jgi:hypothetical protein
MAAAANNAVVEENLAPERKRGPRSRKPEALETPPTVANTTVKEEGANVRAGGRGKRFFQEKVLEHPSMMQSLLTFGELEPFRDHCRLTISHVPVTHL